MCLVSKAHVCQSCLALSTACERPVARCNLLDLLFTGKQEELPPGAEYAWATRHHG